MQSAEGLDLKPINLNNKARGTRSPFLFQQTQLFVPKVKTKLFDVYSIEQKMRNSADVRQENKKHQSFYTQMATSFREKGDLSYTDFQHQNKKLSNSLELNNV